MPGLDPATIRGFRLAARDPAERGRRSTSLELVFDLAAAAAIAAAAATLSGDIRAGEIGVGIARFACNLFMTWLAWSSYSWFASAYDDGSRPFQCLSMAIMFGALTLAGGIHVSAGDEHQWLVLIGFCIMRAGMVLLWLAAARGDPGARGAALVSAGGIAVMQAYWIGLIVALAPDAPLYLPLFALGAVGELAVAPLAARRGELNWHHDHIVDRHNAFNIIVLGQCFATIALIVAQSATPRLAHFWWAGLCAVITFSMWGLYFDRHEQLLGRRPRVVFAWSYGHYPLFAGGAATAAGFATLLGSGTVGLTTTLSVGGAVAVYLLALWAVRDRFSGQRTLHWLLPALAVVILLLSVWTSYALPLIALCLAGVAVARRRM